MTPSNKGEWEVLGMGLDLMWDSGKLKDYHAGRENEELPPTHTHTPFFWEREQVSRERAEGEGERENPKQAPMPNVEMSQGLIPQPLDHDPSPNQESNASLTEPPGAPFLTLWGFFFFFFFFFFRILPSLTIPPLTVYFPKRKMFIQLGAHGNVTWG